MERFTREIAATMGQPSLPATEHLLVTVHTEIDLSLRKGMPICGYIRPENADLGPEPLFTVIKPQLFVKEENWNRPHPAAEGWHETPRFINHNQTSLEHVKFNHGLQYLGIVQKIIGCFISRSTNYRSMAVMIRKGGTGVINSEYAVRDQSVMPGSGAFVMFKPDVRVRIGRWNDDNQGRFDQQRMYRVLASPMATVCYQEGLNPDGTMAYDWDSELGHVVAEQMAADEARRMDITDLTVTPSDNHDALRLLGHGIEEC